MCDALGSAIVGQCISVVGRRPILIIGALINYAIIITMLVWRPSDEQIVVLCVIAGLWGIADAIWVTQITVVYSVFFPDTNEAAFSNFSLWESVGFLVFYLMTPYIRVRIALIILLIFLSLGVFGYIVIEYRWRPKQKTNNTRRQSISGPHIHVASDFRI